MTTLLIISYIWLWLMLGLWACQLYIEEFGYLKLGIAIWSLLLPLVILYAFKSEIIIRKKRK